MKQDCKMLLRRCKKYIQYVISDSSLQMGIDDMDESDKEMFRMTIADGERLLEQIEEAIK